MIPEPEYCLFVRFKDGLTGRVQLHLEDLTGALAPLRDQDFFGRVYIECGAVSWPGDIDLAPDAMHRQVALEQHERERASDFGACPQKTTAGVRRKAPAGLAQRCLKPPFQGVKTFSLFMTRELGQRLQVPDAE